GAGAGNAERGGTAERQADDQKAPEGRGGAPASRDAGGPVDSSAVPEKQPQGQVQIPSGHSATPRPAGQAGASPVESPVVENRQPTTPSRSDTPDKGRGTDVQKSGEGERAARGEGVEDEHREPGGE
ncbi:hypothetical protein, partial [Thiolapillus sp.]